MMNPVVHVKENSIHVYELIKDDFLKLRKTKIKNGLGNTEQCSIEHQMCIMQAVSMVTIEAGKNHTMYSDGPICVSVAIIEFMITLNDHIQSDRTRARLKTLIPDIVNTAPVVTLTSERMRKYNTVHGYKLYSLSEIGREIAGSFEEFPEYQIAEKKRSEMLGPLYPQKPGEKIKINEAIDTVRKAANLYKTTA